MTIFVKVAELRSFVLAAKHFSMTQSGVSNAIQRLENQLGVLLLMRTTRKVNLTDDGQAFFERCRHILAELQDAQLALTSSQAQPTGRLRISLPVSFGRFKIIPILGRFQSLFPDVDIQVIITDRFVDLVDESIDVAIRIGMLSDSRLIARQLTTVRRRVVATPAYLAHHGRPRSPSDLANHLCIAQTFQDSDRKKEWRFIKNGIEQTFVPDGWLSVSDTTAMTMAIVSGYGLGQVHEHYVEQHLIDGSLETVLDQYIV
ncbi:LysR family transcriptional regulator, partial [Methylobacterium sp. WL64]|uniref:LysR family transcriptional regulator n=1 Tax=Methylobacterium sp. WL64 TaxID=2603894 RepID=UPI00164F4210